MVQIGGNKFEFRGGVHSGGVQISADVAKELGRNVQGSLSAFATKSFDRNPLNVGIQAVLSGRF